MKKTDQIEKELLSALEKGQPLEPIRTKYTAAKGSFYIALGRATKIIASKLEGAGAELRELNARVTQGREKLENLGRDIRAREGRNVELDKAKRELDAEFSAKKEELWRATVKAEGEHKERMSELDAELSAKEELLREFKKVGLEPTQGLVLLKKGRDLDKAIAWKSERLKALERKAADLEQNTKDMKANHDAWRWRRDAVREETTKAEARYRWLIQNIQNKQAEMNTISTYLNNLNEERSTLESKVTNLRTEYAELVDAIKTLREHHTQLQTDYDRLLAEVKKLKRIEDEAVEKISRILEAEENRERDAGVAFEAKCKVLDEELARIRKEGEAEVEKQIRELARDQLEKLQISLERLGVTHIELMALGVQRSLTIDEIKKLEEKRRELEKMTSIPSLVAVGQ